MIQQNCSDLCNSSIATKREMIRFTVVPPDRRESLFLMASLSDIYGTIDLLSMMEPVS